MEVLPLLNSIHSAGRSGPRLPGSRISRVNIIQLIQKRRANLIDCTAALIKRQSSRGWITIFLNDVIQPALSCVELTPYGIWQRDRISRQPLEALHLTALN